MWYPTAEANLSCSPFAWAMPSTTLCGHSTVSDITHTSLRAVYGPMRQLTLLVVYHVRTLKFIDLTCYGYTMQASHQWWVIACR